MTVIGWKPVEAYNPNAYLVALNAKSNPLSNVADALSGLGDLGIQYADRAKDEFDLRSKIAKSEQDILDQRNKIYTNEWLADNAETLNNWVTKGSQDFNSMLEVEKEINQIDNPLVRQAAMNHVSTALNNRLNYQKIIADIAHREAENKKQQLDIAYTEATQPGKIKAANTESEVKDVTGQNDLNADEYAKKYGMNDNIFNGLSAYVKAHPEATDDQLYTELQRIDPEAAKLVTRDQAISKFRQDYAKRLSPTTQAFIATTNQAIKTRVPQLTQLIGSNFVLPYSVVSNSSATSPSAAVLEHMYPSIASNKNANKESQLDSIRMGLEPEIGKVLQAAGLEDNPENQKLAFYAIMRSLNNPDKFKNWIIGDSSLTPDFNYERGKAAELAKQYGSRWKEIKSVADITIGTGGLLTQDVLQGVADRAAARAQKGEGPYAKLLEDEQNKELNQFLQRNSGLNPTQQQEVIKAFKSAFSNSTLERPNLFVKDRFNSTYYGQYTQNAGVINTWDPSKLQTAWGELDAFKDTLNDQEKRAKEVLKNSSNSEENKTNAQNVLNAIKQKRKELQPYQRDMELTHKRSIINDTGGMFGKTLDAVIAGTIPKSRTEFITNTLVEGLKQNKNRRKKDEEANADYWKRMVDTEGYADLQHTPDFIEKYIKPRQQQIEAALKALPANNEERTTFQQEEYKRLDQAKTALESLLKKVNE